MVKSWSYLIFLTWTSYLMIVSLLLFTRGFLLNRVSRTERGECIHCENSGDCDLKRVLETSAIGVNICPKPRARVILLVVDALKYEFVNWQDDANAESSYYKNKMPIVNELIQKYPLHTRLYKFIADPPTTTMQRLKGLMTGTLPTFVDISSNFATEDINEDNLIDQNVKGGIVFMGDDTWTSLFPGRFLRQYPAPSFNVWDLDTVDNQVRRTIFSEMKKKDWSLLVAHVLGIDHCGHKHGPNHPEMTRKLNDTNYLIKEIVKSLDEGMMLFVIGDHGMTDTGDHGGDSIDETDAAMFIYSTLPLIDTSTVIGSKVANHVDFVPTIATILGTPMPFSNIGTIILDALPMLGDKNESLDQFFYAVQSLWSNVAQTKKYIDAYSMDTFLFSDDKLQMLERSYNHLSKQVKHSKNLKEFKDFINDAKAYLALIRNMCAEIWVQFDSSLMFKGLLLMFGTLFFSYIILDCIQRDRITKIFESWFLTCSVLTNLCAIIVVWLLYWLQIIEEFQHMTFFATGIVSLLLLLIVVIQNWDIIAINWYNSIKKQWSSYQARIILFMTICGLFSNSYIVEEDRVLSFLSITLVWLVLYNIKVDSHVDNSDRKARIIFKPTSKPSFRIILIILGLITALAIRCSSYFWRCREEHNGRSCSSIILGKANSIVSSKIEQAFLTTALIILALFITVVRYWLRSCGNLSGFSPSVVVARYCPGVTVVCIGCFWVLQRLPKDAKTKLALSWQENALPGVAYFMILFGIFILFYRPLGVFILPRRGESINIYHGEDIIPRLFERLKGLIYKRKLEDENIPIVYGLGTVYSATFISLSVFLTLLYALLLGDVLAPSTVVMYITCACVLTIISVERYRNANSISELFDVPNTAILCWFLMAEYFFYGTGHQPTFLTIHWDAAFIGTGGHYSGNLVPATLIGINTFGSHIILGATLPLLVVAPFTIYLMLPNLVKMKFRPEEDLKRGELLLYERQAIFHGAVFTVLGKSSAVCLR
ncbi:GPI ethanolamine phosphate transferase 3 isoform X2 [Cephus cinctus]|uniref:GPI ethanolamine phosphate transferase 3 isoform X2 n=1 Tax=Cephus cinctus TaxID=211228 RepID=A0AAJ7FIQ4_CEPCN|nr:GPI ethanolamine phosphate transferase 3 isoform X2 [Cephus cinctus]